MISKTKKFLFTLLAFAGLFFSLSGQVKATGTLTRITATPSVVTAGANSNYTITFVTATNILAGGKILVQFPDGFDINGSDNLLDFTDMDLADDGVDLTLGGSASGTTWGATISGQVITFVSGTGMIFSNSVVTVEIGTNAASGAAGDKQIVNINTVADNYQAIVTTKNSANTILDGPTSSIYFKIASSHSETDIDGIYYLRDDVHTHYQNNGNTTGAGTDLGILSKTAPNSDESRTCSDWVQFYFDADGTYGQTNQITNVYYHIWWDTDNTQGTLGYDTTGSYNGTENESITVNDTNSTNKVGDYYLYANKQTFSSAQSVMGNAIYNFGVKLANSGGYPVVISNAARNSFIIIDLADDATLQGLDSDSDGLTDYAELFTYFTNPYDADTDNDGWNDKYEVDNSLNPIDPDEAPTFGKWLIRQFDGGAAGDRFGSSLSSISDIDGDGKDDVLVGAYNADVGALADAGSAYIYSSNTGSLIKQFDGGAAGDKLGYSVSSISDIDGDGKDDVLVGAPYAHVGALADAGSAYIYSSNTGSLIKQFDGEAAGDKLGYSVSSISDIDGDGKDDVLVGAPYASPSSLSGAGSAYIYSSNTGSLIKQYNGAAATDRFGYSVASISDIDGDGKDDVLVGAYNANAGKGRSYIYSSNTGSLIKQYNGAAVLGYFGSSVASISDIDGDGKDDVLVGAYGVDSGTGSAYIYSSNTGSLIKQFDGGATSDYFGISVAPISDIDGDGKDDVLVGAYNADVGALADAGSAYIYSSNTGDLIEQYDGGADSDYFGYSVAPISDIDGDGKDDVLVGAYLADPGSLSAAGSAYIHSSITHSSGYMANQIWAKGSSKASAFDLDDYFVDANNSTVPARNQTITYSASTVDNPYIDVSIGAGNVVSFSQPAEWAGSETVVFTATDSTGLSSTSNTITLTVTGTKTLNSPTMDAPIINSYGSVTWTWTDNSEIEESYRVDYVTGSGNDADGLFTQTSKSSSGSILSWTDDDLTPCVSYSVHVHAYKADTGESAASDSKSASKECGGGGLPPGAQNPPSPPASDSENLQGEFKVRINNDAENTGSPQVTLSLTTGNNTTKMAISNFPDFQNAIQESYQATKQWDLCQQKTSCPTGLYTVFAKFYTQYGQASEVVQDTIFYTNTNAQAQSPSTMSEQERLSAIAKIKQQLILLITQVIQMLTLQVQQMQK